MDGRGQESIAASSGRGYVTGRAAGWLKGLGYGASDLGDLHRLGLPVTPRAPAPADLHQPLFLQPAHRDSQPAALDAGHVFPTQAVTRLEELLVRRRAARAQQPLQDLLLNGGDVVSRR